MTCNESFLLLVLLEKLKNKKGEQQKGLFSFPRCTVLNRQVNTHLKGVLGHAGEAVVGGAGGDGADAELADLIGLTELRDAFWFHHTHQAWGERER